MEDEDDVHVCLVCQTTIQGLMNYVHHKKNECVGKKSILSGSQQNKASSQPRTDPASLQSQINEVINNLGTLNNINQVNSIYKQYPTSNNDTISESRFYNSESNPSNPQPTLAESGVSPNLTYASIFGSPVSSDSKKTKDTSTTIRAQNFNIPAGYSTYPGDQGLLENNDIGDIIPACQDTSVDQEATEKVDDFFLSLELRSSKFPPQGEKNTPNLPISNILSNLTFSSDEEDLGFNFADDVSIDSFSDDTDDMAPPRHYTGGKWKPGQGPGPKSVQLRRRLASRGKWRPGENVAPAPKVVGKRSKRQTKGGKWKPEMSNDKKFKTYSCNFCNISFSNRYMYSSHCGSVEHKENVFGHNKPVESYARGGKAKSISMATRSKTQIYDSEATEDYEKDNEQRTMDESVNLETVEGGEKTSEESEVKGAEVNDITAEKAEQEQADAEGEEEDPTKSPVIPEQGQGQATLVGIHNCTICDKKYNNKYVLSRHLLTKSHKIHSKGHPDAVLLLQKYHKYIVRLSPFQCLICRYFFNKNEFFEKHIKSEEHANNCVELIGEIKCSICSFKTHLHEAMVEHIDGEEHKANVSKCNKLCVFKESHVQCQCKYCGLSVRAYSRLKRHIILKHPEKEVTAPAVKRRVGVHNKPRCSVCDKKCNSESALKIHIRRRHTGEKPFKCDTCSKAFADHGSLELHNKSQKHTEKVLQEKMTAISENQEDKAGVKIENQDVKEVMEHELNETEVNKIIKDVTESIYSLDGGGESGIKTDSDWTLSKKPRGRPKGRKNLDVSEELSGAGAKRRRLHPNKIKCKHCDVIVANYNDLRPHYMKEHSTQVKSCELCDMVFLSARSLRLHYLSRVHQKNMNQNEEAVDDTTYHKCPICLKKFLDQKYCKFHTEYQHNHLNSEEGVLKKYLGQDMTRKKYKDFLVEVEPLDRTATVQCPECKKDLKKNNIMDHLRMHTGDKVFVCRLCRRGFISAVTLRRHLLGHFGCQDCTCEICGKSYKKPSSLEQHLNIHKMEKSGEQKMHICDVCGQSFYFEHQLAQHVRRHQDRKFVCFYPGCHWKFVFKNELMYHLRSHSKEKPYLCDICGYAASTKVRLQRHNVTHTGERKYHCEYCTYKAGNSTHLHRHMRIHIGSKPYKCPYCDYSCNTHENIRKHIAKTKKHEGMKVYPCKMCTFGTNSSKEFRNHIFECHECEIDEKNLEALSSFSGLYSKQEDPKKLAEGMQVIPVKEKVPRTQQRKRKPKVKEHSPVRDEEQESVAKAMLYFSQEGEYNLDSQNVVYGDQNVRVTCNEDAAGKYPVPEYQPVTPTTEINHITFPEAVRATQEHIGQMNQYQAVSVEYQRSRSPIISQRSNKLHVKVRSEQPKHEVEDDVIRHKTAEGLIELIQKRNPELMSDRGATKAEHEQEDQKPYPPVMSMPRSHSVAVMLTPVQQLGYSNQELVYQPAIFDQHGNDVAKQLLSLGQTGKTVQLPPLPALTQQVPYGQNVTHGTSMFSQSLLSSQQSADLAKETAKSWLQSIAHLTKDDDAHVLKSISGQKGLEHPETRSLLSRPSFRYSSDDYQLKEAQEHENGDGGLVIDMSTYIQNE